MNQKLYPMGALLALAMGCAGTDTTDVSPTYRLIDGDTTDPSLLPGDPAFTGEPTGDFGQAAEAWTSDRYHGDGTKNGSETGPCYGPSTNGSPCVFPQFKQINWTFTLDAACLEHNHYILDHGGTQAESTAIFQEIEKAVTALDGLGSGVVSHLNNATGTKMTMPIHCYHTASDLGIFSDTFSTAQIVQLPASGGVDPGSVFYTAPDQSFVDISPENIWDFVVNVCGFHTVGNPQRLALMRAYASQTTKHELLHGFGFGHFRAGMMRTGVFCGQPSTDFDIPQGFGQALGDYVGGGGAVTIKTGSIPASNVPDCTKEPQNCD